MYLFKEEIIKSSHINEIKQSLVQDINNTIIGLNNILGDIRNDDEKYFKWLQLIFSNCWKIENGCINITRRNCSLSVLTMLPKKGLPITCISCIIYALNYASHSIYLFKNFSNIENCNNENNIKLINLSNEISIIRENIIYLNSLEKISVLKNVQSEIIVLHIKNGSGLIKLLNTQGHGAFIRIVSNSIYEVIKRSINGYIKYVNNNNNNIYKNNDYINNLYINMKKSITLTINGYLYKDNEKNEIFRIFDFGLFLTDIHLNKCISLLNGNNIFIQLEIGSSQTNVPFKNGNILNLIELEIILNSFLHFGYNYYSKVFLILKKIIYLKNYKDRDVFTYDDNNKNIYEHMAKWLRSNIKSDGNNQINNNLNKDIVNNDIFQPNQNNNHVNQINNIDHIELTDDQTIYCIIMVNIVPDNKCLFLKKSIIQLLNKPIYSRSLSGFQFKDNKIINEELIEILGESYYNSSNKSKRRTNVFGSRINAREIQSAEKLIKPGLKLIHIAFHNFTSIPVQQRNTFYSANNMFSLFQHRIHYLKEWNPKILIIKKFYPEDIIIKSYNVYSYPKNNNKYWFIISCTVIPFLLIILFILLYKRWFPDNLICFPFLSKHRKNHNKQKRKQNYKYSCSTCRKKCFKHMYKMQKDKSHLRKRLILHKNIPKIPNNDKNSNNLLFPLKQNDEHLTRNRQKKSTTSLFLEEIQTNDIIE
ncbi:hypothetical protein PFHG_01288 [Plasmodium falciparum HB3]|nr:hypothetical protein PFHG_01288 [Plasmodium falciparum HB3]KOB88802.1 hypothetical protein PFDG_03637 [Plasmodium falciparum Dd2]